jgi:hypothetical protein
MNSVQTAGLLFIVGSAVFDFGVGIGVPRVWMERDQNTRLRMLEAGRVSWRIAQPLVGLGAIIAGAGAGYLAVDAATRSSQVVFTIACAAMMGGALAWCWSLYLRGTRIEDFVFGRQPAWPFLTYVLLTISGIALVGVGMLVGEFADARGGGSTQQFPTWLAWLLIVADVGFLAAYIGYKDIPPFVFYLLLLVAGITLV